MKPEGEYKVVIIGDAFVGKTSIINRYCNQTFSQQESPTIAASYLQSSIEIEGTLIKMNLWDTAGHEKFHCVVPLYARTADAMIIVFDLSNPETFISSKKWYSELTDEVGEIPVVILCGNKLDLTPGINTSEFEDWANENKIMFITVSALDGTNVDELFLKIATKIYSDVVVPNSTQSPPLVSTEKNAAGSEKKSCCK